MADQLSIKLPDDVEIKSMKDVVGLMMDIIHENSTPTFASQEIETINEFVANGGDIK